MEGLSNLAEWDCTPETVDNDYSIAANLVAKGCKIQAISLLRKTYGLDLAEAKRICDQYSKNT